MPALQLVANGILLGGMYILIAQSLNLIFGVMGIVNFAHGAFIAMSGLFTYWFATHLHLNPLIAVPLVFAAMTAFGAAVQRLLLERLSGIGRRHELLSLIITFGLSYILIEIALQVFGTDYVSLPDLQQTWVIGGVTFNAALMVSGLVGAAISGLLHAWLNWTGAGKALLAAAQSETGAVSCGIDVGRMRMAAFAIASGLAGLAGMLIILVMPIAAQSAGDLTILAFVMIALGGLGNYKGVAVAALLLGVAQSIAGYYIGGDVETVLPYVLLIVVMAFGPRSLRVAQARR